MLHVFMTRVTTTMLSIGPGNSIIPSPSDRESGTPSFTKSDLLNDLAGARWCMRSCPESKYDMQFVQLRPQDTQCFRAPSRASGKRHTEEHFTILSQYKLARTAEQNMMQSCYTLSLPCPHLKGVPTCHTGDTTQHPLKAEPVPGKTRPTLQKQQCLRLLDIQSKHMPQASGPGYCSSPP